MVGREHNSKICPSCGRILDERDWEICPRCREPIPREGEQLPPPGMLTTFGLGMCGVVIGSLMGFAMAVGASGAEPAGARILTWPAGGAIFLSTAAAWLGPKLRRPARRSFERLLIALMFMAILVSSLAAMGLTNVYALGGILCVGALAIYLHLRRLPADWGLPPQQ